MLLEGGIRRNSKCDSRRRNIHTHNSGDFSLGSRHDLNLEYEYLLTRQIRRVWGKGLSIVFQEEGTVYVNTWRPDRTYIIWVPTNNSIW